MSEAKPPQPPKPGSTILAQCDCMKKETTWRVKVTLDANWYYYSYCCLNCDKNRIIGAWRKSDLFDS